MREKKYKVLPILYKDDIKRFWSKVNILDKDSCWNWKPNISSLDRPKIMFSGIQYYSYRIAYYIKTGTDPKDKLICHSCDNVLCMNPNHLFMGTYLNNNNDKKSKGRQSHHSHPPSNKKYSDDIGAKVRHLYKEKHTLAKIASILDIPLHTVHDILYKGTYSGGNDG